MPPIINRQVAKFAKDPPKKLGVLGVMAVHHSTSGFTSGSTCNPSASLFVLLKSATTAINSPNASPSSPSRFTAAVWELIQ
jgi:hypothetical protein